MLGLLWQIIRVSGGGRGGGGEGGGEGVEGEREG